MADKIICIREYASGPEAYMALDKLVNEGIVASVTDGLSTLYVPAPPRPVATACLGI